MSQTAEAQFVVFTVRRGRGREREREREKREERREKREERREKRETSRPVHTFLAPSVRIILISRNK